MELELIFSMSSLPASQFDLCILGDVSLYVPWAVSSIISWELKYDILRGHTSPDARAIYTEESGWDRVHPRRFKTIRLTRVEPNPTVRNKGSKIVTVWKESGEGRSVSIQWGWDTCRDIDIHLHERTSRDSLFGGRWVRGSVRFRREAEACISQML